jgi:glycosyltransferase involved in cell wall biosynthesis
MTTAVRDDRPLRVALLISADCFEEWLTSAVGIDVDEYVEHYRNDWTGTYSAALMRQGAEPFLYWPSVRHVGLRRAGDEVAVRFLPLRRFYRPWLRFPLLKRTPPGRFVADAANALAFLPALRRALAEDQIDVLYVQDYWTGRFDVLARATSVPLVAANHGQKPGREVKLFKRWTIPRARFQTQTDEQVGELARYGGSAQAVPNFVDDEFFTPGEPDQRSGETVITVARLYPVSKRTDDLIRSLKFLPESWRLDIVGAGPDRERLSAIAAQAGVAKRVRFLGYVIDRERLRDLYRGSAVFSLPSAAEGVSSAVLEAMSCGTPVVVSDIPTLRRLVEGGAGLTVPVGEPQALAEAIQRAGQERDRLGAAARRRIEERYSLQAGGRALFEFLAAAVAHSHP